MPKARIKVTITVEIKDPTQWTLAFGTDEDKIPTDVKDYIGYTVQGSGVFGNGEVDADISWK